MTSPTPPLKCEKCGKLMIKWYDYQVLTGYHCSNCGADVPIHPTAEPSEAKRFIADNLLNPSNRIDMSSQNPTTELKQKHTNGICQACRPTTEPKSVEGEWAERFDREIEHPFLLSENLGSHAPEKIKSFITTLLHDEREEGRAEERERIVKMIDEMNNFRQAKVDGKEDWNNALEQSANKVDALLSSLRDKLSTHND